MKTKCRWNEEKHEFEIWWKWNANESTIKQWFRTDVNIENWTFRKNLRTSSSSTNWDKWWKTIREERLISSHLVWIIYHLPKYICFEKKKTQKNPTPAIKVYVLIYNMEHVLASNFYQSFFWETFDNEFPQPGIY